MVVGFQYAYEMAAATCIVPVTDTDIVDGTVSRGVSSSANDRVSSSEI